jgi:hypothetical protein
MGDRGNIVVKDGNSKVYLYSHWCGSQLPEIARASLKRGKDRWNDGQYLARILFTDMINGDNGTTGYGISSVICDGGETVIVDCDAQTVEAYDDPPMSISEFVSASPKEEAA